MLNRVSLLAMVAGLVTTGAFAGGIERSPQSMSILFEEGRAAQLTFGYVSPEVTGVGPNSTRTGLTGSGDMSPSYSTLSFGYKMPLTDKLDLAVIYDQSIGADVNYASGTGYIFSGLSASLDSFDITALLRYKIGNGMSVYGGLRAQSIVAELEGLPTPAGLYSLDVDRNYALGYAVGVAYEKPEIALRVALTYNSAIDHELSGDENFLGGAGAGGGDLDVTIPQSVNLEFQSGIAQDTLLFGSIRWQDWSEFNITPAFFTGVLAGATLIEYESDYTTYTLGVGRRFNETWSGAITVAYEGATGDIQGNLAPRDGFASIGVGATYTRGNTKITGGVRYIELGDATTQSINADFSDNSAIAVGFRLVQTF